MCQFRIRYSKGGIQRTGGGFFLNPRFLTCSTNATGRFLAKLNPYPVIAVGGMSLLTMPLRLR
jgi:hypothetical protein